MSSTYEQAGVSIEAGDRAVELIKERIGAATRPEVRGDLGGFAGLFDGRFANLSKPILVSGTDGVGTKTLIAQTLDVHDTIGIDAVAMVVDDVVCEGAEPLFVLDYIAIGKVIPSKIADLVSGVAEGCRQAGAALLGGETAEHPGVMDIDEYDLATFCVGVVDEDSRLGAHRVREGDAIIGFASSGLHANGYSLVRKLILDHDLVLEDRFDEAEPRTLGEVLLTPCRIHSPAVLALARESLTHAAAHITGGGITGNLPRVLPEGLGASVDPSAWKREPIFGYLERLGQIEPDEAWRVFNRGLGMMLVVPSDRVDDALALANAHGETAVQVGSVTAGSGVSFS
ncbi:MAG: phosphoribosylformylglycinamidine cyclo-ligase [Actinomycetota bacterium]